MEKILEMKKIVKRFPGLVANDHIDFDVIRGEVHTLLGENGAGKSTLMNVLCGLYAADEGEIYFRKELLDIRSPREAVEKGIGMVHQNFMLIPAMDVVDNIVLGTRGPRHPWLDKEESGRIISELSEHYGLKIRVDRKISELSVGEQQRVEIIKALFRKAELLILDEPTAVLTPEESANLFQVIRALQGEGKTIIFISHKLKEVMEISDRITILRKGKKVTTLSKEETSAEELADLMVGKKVIQETFPKVHSEGPAVFRLESVHAMKGSVPIADLSLEVRAGEVLGIAGVDGNGQSELASLATGLMAPDRGTVFLKEIKMDRISAKAFIDAGVAHIPEDRNKTGLVGEMSIRENMILKSSEQDAFCRYHGWQLKHDKITSVTQELEKEFDIRSSGIECKAGNLSGGNQQKVILAREFYQNPDFIVAVHPTRGLDIGATNFVHSQIIRARDRGCAVLLISADLDEILSLSDRIAVMYEGKILGYEDGASPNVQRIGLMMAGRDITVGRNDNGEGNQYEASTD